MIHHPRFGRHGILTLQTLPAPSAITISTLDAHIGLWIISSGRTVETA